MRAGLTVSLAAMLALGACTGGSDEAEGLTRAEQQRLDDAAARLDAVQDNLDSELQQSQPPPEEAPPDESEH